MEESKPGRCSSGTPPAATSCGARAAEPPPRGKLAATSHISQGPSSPARSLLAEHEIGSVEVGKKADLVLPDRRRPEWTPLLNVAAQLVWSADGRGVHTVFVDGRKVVDDYRLTTIDEFALYNRAQTAGEAIIARSTLEDRAAWQTI